MNKIINIPLGNVVLEGELIIPEDSKSLVIFSHGSGSSRFSTRNNFVAKELHKYKISTFLLDLLTKEEDENYANRFDIKLLTNRLTLATKHIISQEGYSNFEVGYFGASTGAASALGAAVELPTIIKTVVSRGGRPDLVMEIIPDVKAPTLLIVGGLDYEVLELNKKVFNALTCEKKIEIIPNATHLFEESNTLSQVANHAAKWFKLHLQKKEKQIITIK